MRDDDVNEWISRWRLDKARQERVQHWLLIGLTALALGGFVATLQL